MPSTKKAVNNPNHPKKNSTIRVDPIKKLKDIRSIKKLLHDQPRNLCLFTLGINTNLRASDLLRITAGMVRHLEAGDELTLKPEKVVWFPPADNIRCRDSRVDVYVQSLQPTADIGLFVHTE